MTRKNRNTKKCPECGVAIYYKSTACKKHAERNRKPEEDRFWEKVKKIPNGCWEWTADLSYAGYGIFVVKYDKNNPTTSRSKRAYRYLWEKTYGSVPDGKLLDHICKNRACVKPTHLRAVSHYENAVLYSNSPVARRAKSVSCPNGHKYTTETLSLHYRPNLKKHIRTCLICAKARNRRNRCVL